MKMRMLLIAALAALCVHPLLANAQNFQLYWRGTYFVTNASGQAFSGYFTEQSFINKIARDNNLDASKLAFVYRADKRDTAVVWASNGAFVADVIQMEYNYFDVGDPTGGLVVRQAFLYDEAHQGPIGSVVGGERPSYDGNGNLTNDSFSGMFQFRYPEYGAVYFGSFWTGQRIGP